MNKFTWGNLNAGNVHIDPESRRTAEQTRLQFVYLAQALIAEGKNDSAIQVLDRALELFPHHNITYNVPIIYFVQSYFRAGATEKGLTLANQFTDIYETNLRYFERFPAKHRKFMETYIRESVSALGYLRHQMLVGFEEPCKDLFERLDKLLEGRVQV